MSDFLLELHTEELPPKGLTGFTANLKQNLAKELEAHSITYDAITEYATPRRIAVLVHNILSQTEDKTEYKKGPSTSAPEQAVAGFARGAGVELSELTTMSGNKGEYYYHTFTTKGVKTANIIIELCNTAITNMHFARPMRWGANPFSFIRPVHLVTTLLDDMLIHGEVLGVQTRNITHGLRSTAEAITITHANKYRETLLQDGIEVDFTLRKAQIWEQITTLAGVQNITIVENDVLLDEVTAIVENPKAFMGQFDEQFLDLPIEVISQSMAEHQKYFTVLDATGKLKNNFIAVSNNNPQDMSTIISGNEKVVRPRLADAEFFYSTDKATTLEAKRKKLKNVLFIKGIGSMFDKSERTITLSEYVATVIDADTTHTKRAATLLKADLTSGMVLEFTSLQGIMGGYYAAHDNEAPEVADALRTQYQPKFAGDAVPTDRTSIAVNIADKLDTICGVFLVGNAPTGSKDPFALRRLSLGLLRIIIENKLTISLPELIQTALSGFEMQSKEGTLQTIHTFMIERLRGYYEDQDIGANIFNSALVHTRDAYDFDQRIHALHRFMSSAHATSLIDTNKRIANILKDAKVIHKEFALTLEIEHSLLKEITLLESVTDYGTLITNLEALRLLLDRFFSEVMINDEDEIKRANRLALISKVRSQFGRIGDFAILL